MTEKKPPYTCPRCHTGVLLLRPVTYFVRTGDDWIVVPEFPAWVCDVCGYTEYDQKTLAWLNVMLLSSNRPYRPRRHPPVSPRGSQRKEPK